MEKKGLIINWKIKVSKTEYMVYIKQGLVFINIIELI